MLRFTGFPAWVVWAGVHIYFLIGFANRFFVMSQWALAFLTKRRQVRVFPGPFDSARGLAHDCASRSHTDQPEVREK
jgi:NADH dehydrogenase